MIDAISFKDTCTRVHGTHTHMHTHTHKSARTHTHTCTHTRGAIYTPTSIMILLGTQVLFSSTEALQTHVMEKAGRPLFPDLRDKLCKDASPTLQCVVAKSVIDMYSGVIVHSGMLHVFCSMHVARIFHAWRVACCVLRAACCVLLVACCALHAVLHLEITELHMHRTTFLELHNQNELLQGRHVL